MDVSYNFYGPLHFDLQPHRRDGWLPLQANIVYNTRNPGHRNFYAADVAATLMMMLLLLLVLATSSRDLLLYILFLFLQL